MKRILFSILISFGLVVTYMVLVSIIFVASKYNLALLPYLNFPVRLPQIIFYYFSPPTAEDYQMKLFTDRKIFLTVASFMINILLYAIPAYFFLRFISKFRKPKTMQTEPPPPPVF